MQDYCDTGEKEQTLVESIKALEKVNKSLAKLNLQREKLTTNIIEAFSHSHEGQKTYEYDMWKIEIKTPCIYSLNKKLYESGNYELPEDYNPIRATTAYTINKTLCEEYLGCAPERVRDSLIALIDKKPGKAGVVIKERTQ